MRELFREFAAARLKREDDENARITQAWQVVRIYAKAMKDKRLPKLASLWIGTHGKGRKQTAEEMKSALAVIREQMRGVKPKKRGK